MLSRRALIGKLAAGAAGAAVAWTASAGRAKATSTRDEASPPTGAGAGNDQLAPGPEIVDAGPPETASAAPPWELVRPLALGAVVAPGWRVAALSGVVDGSCVLTLSNARGRTQRVHLCRNDGRPQGVVHTGRYDLVVMNGGQGDVPTEEGLAQAVAAVAQVLAANEGQQPELVTALLPHAERLRLFAGPVDRRLR